MKVLFSFNGISTKGPFLYYVLFAVQSESEIRFFAVEPINTFFLLLFFMFFSVGLFG